MDLLACLWNPSPLFHLHYALLDSLLATDACSLLLETSNPDDLLVSLFWECYANVNAETPEHIYLLFAQLLVQLVNDSPNIPDGVTKLIVLGFESGKGNPKVHQLSLDICKSTTVKLQRHFSLFFNDLMTEEGGVYDDDSSGAEDEEEDPVVVKKPSKLLDARIIQAHNLLLEVLNAHAILIHQK